MTIRVSWFNKERTAVLWVFEENWTSEDFHEIADRTIRITRNIPIFDVIVDAAHITALPAHSITSLRKRYLYAPENFGMSIIYGANTMMKAMLSVGARLPPIKDRFVFVPSQYEARELVKRRYQQYIDAMDAKTQNFTD